MSALARLLEQATPGPWTLGFDDGSGRGEDGDGIFVRSESEPLAENKSIVSAGCDDWGVPHGVLRDNDARLIALAPDLARLLIDMAAWIDGKGGMDDGAALLARFAELEQKAAP